MAKIVWILGAGFSAADRRLAACSPLTRTDTSRPSTEDNNPEPRSCVAQRPRSLGGCTLSVFLFHRGMWEDAEGFLDLLETASLAAEFDSRYAGRLPRF